MNILPYDHTDPKSIENYAKNLIGLSFFDALKKTFYIIFHQFLLILGSYK